MSVRRHAEKQQKREMMTVHLKTPEQIALMREAGRIVADTLSLLRDQAKPGITTKELDDSATTYIRQQGAMPSFPLVQFPGSVCISVNNEVVHGVPGQRVLRDGDVVSLDTGVVFQGYHGDACLTVGVGAISPVLRQLLTVTERALALALGTLTTETYLFEMGGQIERYVESHGLHIMRNFVGHGIGTTMHEAPHVPNYYPSKSGRGLKAQIGLVFTIEPIVTLGRDGSTTLPDKWTAVTNDGAATAQFEHTVAITAEGPTILTRPTDARNMWAAPQILAAPSALGGLLRGQQRTIAV